MKDPLRWTLERLKTEADRSRSVFQSGRLDEPSELYSRFFQGFTKVFENLLPKLPNLIASESVIEDLVEALTNPDTRTAFRYLAAPPISEDDLKTLAATTLSAAALKKDHAQAKRVRDVVRRIIDPHRFPWVTENRTPARHEITTAVISSATLVAANKLQTMRRMGAKKEQEEKVKQLLRKIGFVEISGRPIPLLAEAPKPGEFCGESKLGELRADIVVGLHDRRVMPIECKVSNSEVNSFKRVNHEAVGKARVWLNSFGEKGTVPAAVLSGVFNPTNLEMAQNDGLSLFWSHRLNDLAAFVRATRT